jgi:3-oxoadipate enol-lactonase
MNSAEVLAHQVEGDGEPVLILNGGLMTYAAWEPVSSHLAKHYRLVLNDLRGQLLSPGAAPAAIAENVDDLTALLDHLEIETTHVLGTSYGGEVALFFAALRPERVRSLIAVTVMDYATESIRLGVEDLRFLVADALAGGDKGRLHERVVEEVYSASFQERYAEDLTVRREQVTALPDTWFKGLEGIMAAMETLDARPYLGGIRCPTLIVIAAEDRVIPPERSVALAGAISGAETRVHETSGHALVAEDPPWLTEVCLEFLRRHSTPAE